MTGPGLGTAGGIDEVLAATRAERAARAPGVTTVDVGPARVDEERCDGATSAFVVDTGDLRLGDRLLTSLYLAASPDSGRIEVVDALAWEDRELRLVADLAGPERLQLERTGVTLHLYASSSETWLLRTLEERLAELHDGPAAAPVDALLRSLEGAAGPGDELPGAPTLGVILGSPERRLGQLATALEQLVAAGRSVLLLSTDNQTLDRLLLAAHRGAGQPPAGNFLRVGFATTRDVGGDRRLTLEGAALSQAPDVVARRHQLGAELRRVGAAAYATIARAADRDRPEATSADDTSGSVAAARALDQGRRALQAADRAVERSVEEARAASTAHARARQVARSLDDVRTIYALVDELGHRVEQAGYDTAASAAGVGRLAGPAARQPGRSRPASRGRAGTTDERQLLVAAEVAAARLDRRDDALARLDEQLAIATALPHRRADVAAADRELSRARTAHAEAERATLRLRAERARAAQEVAKLARELSATAADSTAGASSARAAPGRAPAGPASVGASSMSATLGGRGDEDVTLSAPERALIRRLGELRAAYAATRTELGRHHRAAIGDARLVAATFGQLVGNPAVYERRYDNVVIEGAGTVPAALALWAVSRADRAVTLVAEAGDTPPRPVLDGDRDGHGGSGGRGDNPPADAEARWMTASLLELLGLADRTSVTRHPHGMVLN